MLVASPALSEVFTCVATEQCDATGNCLVSSDVNAFFLTFPEGNGTAKLTSLGLSYNLTPMDSSDMGRRLVVHDGPTEFAILTFTPNASLLIDYYKKEDAQEIFLFSSKSTCMQGNG